MKHKKFVVPTLGLHIAYPYVFNEVIVFKV